MIDLKRLRHLTVLVQHGNFHRAAEALHLTQPALSRSIQALEAHVGAPLLTRQRLEYALDAVILIKLDAIR